MNIELKDYFAAKAMQALAVDVTNVSVDNIVMTSYHIAEKMIEHRNKLINDRYINRSNQIKLDNVENL